MVNVSRTEILRLIIECRQKLQVAKIQLDSPIVDSRTTKIMVNEVDDILEQIEKEI